MGGLLPSAHDVRNHLCLSTRLTWRMFPEAVLGFRRIHRNCSIDGVLGECASSRPTPCEGYQVASNLLAGTPGDPDARGRREEGNGYGRTPQDRGGVA